MTGAPSVTAEPTAAELEPARRAQRFVDELLIPHEETAELAGGRLDDALRERIEAAAIDARLQGGRHRPEHGGQGWTAVETMLVKEQLGRATNGLYSLVPNAYNVLAHGTEAQIARHLVPALRGEPRGPPTRSPRSTPARIRPASRRSRRRTAAATGSTPRSGS